MEKLKKHITKEYSPLIIYINDLEKIVAVLEANSIKFFIETDNYKYVSIIELKESVEDRNTKNLKIGTSNPYITIEFLHFTATIRATFDNFVSIGIFHELDKIINKSQRFSPFLYSYPFVFITPFLLYLDNIFVNPNGALYPEYIDTFLAFLFFIWIIRATYIKLVKHSTIILSKKENLTNFFQRKKDDLILMILSTIVGAILGILGTIFITKIMPR